VARSYWRPGATPLERLEGYLAARLRTQERVGRRLAALLATATGHGPDREAEFREALIPGSIASPAEALGMARAAMFLCRVCDDGVSRLTGDPETDLRRLLSGELRHDASTSPCMCAWSEMVEGYCYMGASFARGMDRLFLLATRRPFNEHLHRAMTLVGSAA
jgi:hypothetical protein